MTRQETQEARLNIEFIRQHYASSIIPEGKRFYYENSDNPAARFYFTSWEAAAADLAIEIGVTEEERAAIKSA